MGTAWEQGARKGPTSQGAGQGSQVFPGERKSPNLKPEEQRAEPTTEEVKCPKCPNTHNWTTRAVCRSCGCKLPQRNVSKPPRPQKSAGPASVKTGGDGSSTTGASFGNLLCLCCQRRNRPGRNCQRRKGHPAKESRINREMVGGHGQRRPSQRGPRKPTRTAPSCLERSPQPGSETRFSHGQNAQKPKPRCRSAKNNSARRKHLCTLPMPKKKRPAPS